ncbi:hypothetical protein BJ875DRAFT_138833 [Amylocarpus encephaloides]|uniref:Altered inheritance of mitochondria protein 11 n=1 Tax=Amylocarpus encephaloides TaxID=45428 RepID=A0A9P7YCL3_9HELO|nr:hypothetical protein BJ875DRAFT_138833 [Amylocarpus encephaloides]
MAFLQQPSSMAQPPPIRSSQPSEAPESQSAFFSQRSRRQLGLFVIGAGFVAASAAITRRSLVKRYKASVPRFYQPSNRPTEVNGGLEAFEALNVATVNVVSSAIMVSGGLLWAFDISSVDDMRKKVRRRMGAAGSDEDKGAEEEIEEWVASILSRKEFKHLKSMERTKDEEEKKS